MLGGLRLLLQPGAAGPAEVEGGRILLAALRANHRGTRAARSQELLDQLACPGSIAGILDPDLRERGVDGQLARDARGVRVEDARPHAAIGEEVGEKMRLGQVCRGIDALQNRYDSMPLTPSSLTPERPETL